MQEDTYFYYCICDFGHLHEVNESSLPHGVISKKKNSRPLFTIIFMPKIVFLGTDSILKVKLMYESVR
jgi:hypothetical protein